MGLGRWLRVACVSVSLVTVVPDVVSVATGRYCQDWYNRSLPHEPLSGDLFADAAESSSEVQVSWLPAGFSGLSLPGVVLYSEEPEASLWLHEMTHQAQMRREGLLRYSFNYAKDWVVGRYQGCGPLESYRAIRYEREAQQVTRFGYPLVQEGFAAEEPDAALDEVRSVPDLAVVGHPFLLKLQELLDRYRASARTPRDSG